MARRSLDNIMVTLGDGGRILMDMTNKVYAGKSGGHATRPFGRESGSAKTRYICRICKHLIDTESSQYPMTAHAEARIISHMRGHVGS
jgi:hypothetical protein